ncbi:hypothetical protein EDB82DRAFT_197763 [Fusarium venenatum]|uniref:uncharacterized protein n=1 Tax=Fusarium venenatum TaxID=56646 RepID=UPI001E112714|nr:hypothetical protein EDB82DRAFT_197763 [Fusarium venenatum]
MATPDLGSDYNVMSASVVKQLRLNVQDCFLCKCMGNKFKMANGRVITCKGLVWTCFAFPSEEALNLPIGFHVLEPLATSIVIGRKFLNKTSTLTTHLNRFVHSPRPFWNALSTSRILHLKAPSRTLQCSINSTLVGANVDTRAEMNLASPEFAARSGVRIKPADQQHQFVQLADGSITSIIGSFRARFNPFDKPSNKTLRLGPRMQKFYILDGLTSDVLLGRQLLLEMYAFVNQVNQSNTFFDMKRPSLHDDLNVIAWIEEWRGMFGWHPVERDYREFSLPLPLQFLFLCCLSNIKVVDVKHSTFWFNVETDVLNERDRPHQIQTCLTEAEEQMRQKQELYLKRRQQTVEANKKQKVANVSVNRSQ